MLQTSVAVDVVAANESTSASRGAPKETIDSDAIFSVKTDDTMPEPEQTSLAPRPDLPSDNFTNRDDIAHTGEKSFTAQSQSGLGPDVSKAQKTEHRGDGTSSLGFRSDETSTGDQSAPKEATNHNTTALPPGFADTKFRFDRAKHADPRIVLGGAAMGGEGHAVQDVQSERFSFRNDLAAPTRTFAAHESVPRQYAVQERKVNTDNIFFSKQQRLASGPDSRAPKSPTFVIESQHGGERVHDSNIYDVGAESTRKEHATTTNSRSDLTNRDHVGVLPNRSMQNTPDNTSSTYYSRHRQFVGSSSSSSSAPTLPRSWVATHDGVASDGGASDSNVYLRATESTRDEHSIITHRKSDREDRTSMHAIKTFSEQILQKNFADSTKNGIEIIQENEQHATSSPSEHRIRTDSGQQQTSESAFTDENITNKHDPIQPPATYARETNSSIDTSPPSSGTSSTALTEHAVELKLQRTRAKLDRLKRQQAKAQHNKDHYRLAFTVVAIEETETLVAELEKKLSKHQKVVASDEGPAFENLASSPPVDSGVRGRTSQQNTATSRRSSNLPVRPSTTPERRGDNLIPTTDSVDSVQSNDIATVTSTAQEDDVESFLSRIRKEMKIQTPLVHAVKERAVAAAKQPHMKQTDVPAVPNVEHRKDSASSSARDGDKSGEYPAPNLRPTNPVSDNSTPNSDDAARTDRRYSFPTLETSSGVVAVKGTHRILESKSLESTRDYVRQNVSTTSTSISRGNQRIDDSHNHNLMQRTETAREQHVEDQWDLVEAAAEKICRSNPPPLEASSTRSREENAKNSSSIPLHTTLTTVNSAERTTKHTQIFRNSKALQREYRTESAHTHRAAVSKQILNSAQQQPDQHFDAPNLEKSRYQQQLRRHQIVDRAHQFDQPRGVPSRSHRENVAPSVESKHAHSRPQSLHATPDRHRGRESAGEGANAFVSRYDDDGLSPVRPPDSVVPRRPEGWRGPETHPEDALGFSDRGSDPPHASIGNALVSSPADPLPIVGDNRAPNSPPSPLETSRAPVLTSPMSDDGEGMLEKEDAKSNVESRERMLSLSPIKWPLDQFQTPMQRRVGQICAGASLHSFGRDLHYRLAGFHHFKLQQEKSRNTELLLAALQSPNSSPPPPPARLTIPSMTHRVATTTAPVASTSMVLNAINMDKLDTFVSNVPSKSVIN